MGLVRNLQTLLLVFVIIALVNVIKTQDTYYIKGFGVTKIVPFNCKGKVTYKDNDLSNDALIYSVNTTHVTIRGIRDADLGKYICTVGDSYFNLALGKAPALKTGLETSTSVTLGGTFSLSCTVNSVPQAKFKWFFNGSSTTDGTLSRKVHDEFSTGVFSKTASLKDNGPFKCIATNEFGSVESSTLVKVFALKFVKEPSTEYKILQGDVLRIESIVAGFPLPILVSWKINGKTTYDVSGGRIYRTNKKLDNYTLSSVLTISRSEVTDSGTVEFEGHTQLQNVTSRSILRVIEPPVAVENLRINASYQSLDIQWKFSDQDSNIIHYQVSYRLLDAGPSNLSTTTDKYILLKDLKTDARYEVCVKAVSNEANGPRTCVEIKTLKFEFANLTLSRAELFARNITLRLNDIKADDWIEGYRVVMVAMETTTKAVIEERNIDNFTRLFTFKRLKPYKSYTFTAVQEIGKMKSTPAKYVVITLQDAPSAPESISIENIMADSLNLKWTEPKEKNGIITEYFVRYSFQKGDQLETFNKSVTPHAEKQYVLTITGLYGYVQYDFTVTAKTIKYGTVAQTRVRTTETKPAAPENLAIADLNATSISVSWDEIPNYLIGGSFTSYQIIVKSNDTGATVSRENTKIIAKTISGLKPYTLYSINVQALTINNDGYIKSTIHKTTQAPPSKPTSVTVVPTRSDTHHISYQRVGHAIEITWGPPDQLNGIIKGYQIQYWKTNTCVNTRCRRSIVVSNITEDYINYPNPSSRKHTIENLAPFTRYALKVREKTVALGEFSDVIKTATFEGNPSAPMNVTHTKLTYNSITISWDPPISPNGLITYYSILLYRDGKRERPEIVKDNENNSQQAIVKPLQATINDLESQTTYQVHLSAVVGKTDHLRGESKILIITTAEEPAGFPWHFVLIGCLATVLLLAVVIAIFLLMNRRRGKYEEVRQADQIDLSAINKSKVIGVNDLKNYCKQQHANSDHGFQQEFESVRIPVHTFTWEHSQMPYNQSKNRYSNIVAYDHSRVILNQIDNDPSSTYINANYINGYQQQKKFIAAQGPLPDTVLDFWRMVWEQNTPIIVMLTKLMEDSKIKCEQYWPEGKALQYKDIVVTVASVSEYTDYIVRVFVLYKINNPELGKREVRQFHYMSWPDHGVPSHPTAMLSFVRHVMSYMDSRRQEGPIVVHCSAGVGRTGTFIAIESGLRQIEHDETVDVYGCVCRMRMRRNFMVQIEAQYTFIYDSLLDSVVCGNTEIAPSELLSKIRFLNQVDPKTGKTNFYEEFKRLESGVPTESGFGDASLADNKQKNRYLNILPYDNNRVKLVPIAGSRQSDYINASMIDGFQQKRAFIATQAPLENTVTDFWRMVQEKNIRNIVMLTRLQEKEQDKCYLYWPQAGTVCYGAIHVELVNVQKENEAIIVHEFRVTNRESGKSWPVKHFMYIGWPDTGSPSSGSEFIQLIALVQKAQFSVDVSGPTLIHCSGGAGRTGVFIAVSSSIEKLRSNDVIDIFQTVRQLRLQRVAMVQTLDQYIFCYTAIKDYLDSFDLYANPQVNC